MKMTYRTKLLSLILCVVLTWTAALITGCTDNTAETPDTGTIGVTTASSADTEDTAEATAPEIPVEGTAVGEGATVFTFTVTDKDGRDTVFNVKTDKTTVGEALLDLGLIEGDDGAYGLYVKKVNGITADYDTNGTYWAFYVNGEYAMTGVDSTNVEAGASYAFKVEK